MRDCTNAEMRDALPDLMHGTLPARRQAEVRAHVDGCEACRVELALLARVRGAVFAPRIATDRIVARLPRYWAEPRWRRIARSPAFRVAAAVVLMAGGVSFLLQSGEREAARIVHSVAGDAPRELAVGETFADVSDSALVALVEAMENLDATLSEDPESILVPLVPAEEEGS